MRSLTAAPVALFPLLAPPAWGAAPSDPAAPAGTSCPLELATSIAGAAGAGPVAAVERREPGGAEPVRPACLRLATARGDGPAARLVRPRGAELVPVEGAIDRREPDGPFEPTAGGGLLPRRVKP